MLNHDRKIGEEPLTVESTSSDEAQQKATDELFAQFPEASTINRAKSPDKFSRAAATIPTSRELTPQLQPVAPPRINSSDDSTSGDRLRLIAIVSCLILAAILFVKRLPALIDGGATHADSSQISSTLTGNDLESDFKLTAIPIEELQVGDRVVGTNPIRDQADEFEPEPITWRKISLHMQKESGLSLSIDLLRPLEWIQANGVGPGKTIFLSMPDMGAVGDAEVTYLGACTPIKPGTGTVVTGKFTHQADANSNVVRLRLEGQTEATGVTANHPYWSEDRREYVEVGNLRLGELVNTKFGLRRVESITTDSQYNGQLYNIETTEHVYRVGSVGTLVHNFCAHRITLDAQKRVRSAIAHIRPTDLGTGTATNSATRAAARATGNSTDDAGHLIGRLLGGPGGKKSGNFFAQNPRVNRGIFRDMEGEVAELVRNGHDVWLRVTPKYSGTATRAFEIQVQIRVDGVTRPLMSFPN